MKIAIPFILFFFLSACSQLKTDVLKDWKEFSNDHFSFYAPETLKKQDITGIDSFVEKYNDENTTVAFDYGVYGNATGDCDKPIYVLVDYKPAKMCFYKDKEIDQDKPFVTAISLIKPVEQMKLTFWVLSKNETLQKEAEKIVRSIKFK